MTLIARLERRGDKVEMVEVAPRWREAPTPTSPLWEPRFERAARSGWQRWFLRSLFTPAGVNPWESTRSSAVQATKSMRLVLGKLAEMGVEVRRTTRGRPVVKQRGPRGGMGTGGESLARYTAVAVHPRPVEPARPSYCHFHSFYNALKVVHPDLEALLPRVMGAIDAVLYRQEG